MSATVRISTALTPLRQHAALLDGSVRIPGVELAPVDVPRYLEIFRRMARDQEFDVCEFSVTSYLTAREHGLPFSALPIFPRHRFHHNDFVVHRAAGIAAPADLAGKRIGTRSWTVTPGVWDRGLLHDEFGLEASAATWVLGEREHIPASNDLLPAQCVPPDGRPLFDRLCTGELAAGVAGVKKDTDTHPDVVPLFDDPVGLDREQYARTGFLPVFTLIAVHDRVLVDRPWLPQALYDGFRTARRSGADVEPSVLAVGVDDPAPVGLAANRVALRELLRHCVEQQILAGAPEPDEIFLPVG